MADRRNMSLEERMKRADNIRAQKAEIASESQKEYKKNKQIKFNKIVTIILTTYVVISFLPIQPNKLKQTEIVTKSDYEKYTSTSRRGTHQGNLIFITTNMGNKYQFEGRTLGNHSFTVNDTIESIKNLLFKTEGVNHLKYSLYYPLDRSNALLFLMAILCFVLLIYCIINDYKYASVFNTVTIAALAIFILYIFLV